MESYAGTIKATINGIIRDIDSNAIFDKEKKSLYLKMFEEYECWQPLIRLLRRCINEEKSRKIEYYITLAKIYNKVLNDLQTTAQVCSQVIKDCNLTYPVFHLEMLAEISSQGEYFVEATVLETVYSMFSSPKDTILCLERLCFIYEKKRHDEARLNECYEKLMSFDANNIKALRYFKAMHTQCYDWEGVIRILKTLHASYERPNDKYLAAQEMAAIYQYQMDQPQKALDTIQDLCADSPLDTSIIRYDAFSRLRDWGGCLRTLDYCLKRAGSSHDKAIIYLKMGDIQERQGNSHEACASYHASLRYDPETLESYERLIYHALSDFDWPTTIRYLELLKSHVKNQKLVQRIAVVRDDLKKLLGESQ